MPSPRPMSAPADTAARGSTPILLCAVGLFLTVVEITGFGFDFANDTVGFVLVCIGAARLPADPGRVWSLFAAVSAGLAAVVSLFTYGGPAGQVLPMTYRLWNTMFHLDTTATAGVVIGLLLMVRATAASTTERASLPVRALPFLAALYALSAAFQMLLFASQSAYFGPLGHLRQVVGVMIGLLQSLTVIAVFLAARTRT